MQVNTNKSYVLPLSNLRPKYRNFDWISLWLCWTIFIITNGYNQT